MNQMVPFTCVFAAAVQLPVWLPAEWLLQVPGERASQRRVEEPGGTEEELWEGEKELYRGGHKTEPRGDKPNKYGQKKMMDEEKVGSFLFYF